MHSQKYKKQTRIIQGRSMQDSGGKFLEDVEWKSGLRLQLSFQTVVVSPNRPVKYSEMHLLDILKIARSEISCAL